MAIDIAELRTKAIIAAEDGDWSELAALLREGEKLSQLERNFIADKLEGKLRLKSGKTANYERIFRVGFAYQRMINRLGYNPDAAQAEIARKIGVTERQVRKYLSEYAEGKGSRMKPSLSFFTEVVAASMDDSIEFRVEPISKQ